MPALPSVSWVDSTEAFLDQLGIPGAEHLKEQVRGLATRLNLSEADLWEHPDARRLHSAIATLPEIVRSLDITAINERLSWDRAAKLVFNGTAKGVPRLWKIDGDFGRERPCEVAVMNAIRASEVAHGVTNPRTPRGLVSGRFRGPNNERVLVVAFDLLQGERLSGFAHQPPIPDVATAIAAGVEVARFLGYVHSAEIPDVGLINFADEVWGPQDRSWEQAASGPLRSLVARIDGDALLADLRQSPRQVLLHGDITGENLVRPIDHNDIRGNLVGVDPSGVYGDPEADIARTVARFTKSAHLTVGERAALLDEMVSAYPGTLDQGRLAKWLLAETVR